MPQQVAQEAVLLMAFGGPESLDEVPGFVTRLTGRKLPPPALAAVVDRYRLVGGRSPLPETTRAQARALEAELARRNRPVPVRAGFQFSDPDLAAVVRDLIAGGAHRIAAITMAPYRSQHSTAAYETTVRKAVEEQGAGAEIVFAPDWYLHPRYLDALEELLRESLAQVAAEERDRVPVIFSAHSLPVEYVEKGDPYPQQFEATALALAERLGLDHWRLAYQSKSGPGGEWLGPEVEEVLEEFARAGARTVVVDPIGFTVDHLETLYDNDVVHRRKAEELGLRFIRTACPNTRPTFIAALADLAEAALGGKR
ncbi:ferrochelatase [Caldinitratiruptor microaerophilus]|uniref:Coproporphyrin III ferrochelatase n=1 Tax=Caldinitratiruptor microaerophilus TaxID=671077 RepID=A0AA35CPB3_9FIRM|nr:ferrochelatase [Caldinitratiruptor microaerophilus]BDG62308.1 ferrochelatase [Caldinitratiruptor microaerophilus]